MRIARGQNLLYLKKQKIKLQKKNVKFTKEFNTNEEIIIYESKITYIQKIN